MFNCLDWKIEGRIKMKSTLGNKANLAIILLSAAVLLFTACAGHPPEVTPISRSENPQQLINDLDNDIAMARKNQVNVLAPTWFKRAENSLIAAKADLEKGGQILETFENISTARGELQQAEAIAKTARSTIPDAIKARELARQAGATNLGSEYTTVEYGFLDLIGAIEKNDLAYAKRRQAVVTEQYRQIELRAIKIQTIGEVRRLIEDARKKGLHRTVPQSFAAAQKKLTEADNFITENPYQKEKMHQLAAEALFMARRIHPVAAQTEIVEDMEPEQIVLWAEGILHQTTQTLGAPDMRDRSFDDQIENILATISAQHADHEFMVENSKKQQEEIENLQKNIANLEGQTIKEQKEKERLLAEKKFNEKLSSIQHYFKPNEAEVYKKENQVIIRLKAMQFPVGQSVILPDNYTLLSKVQSAIRTFGEPDVIIGGHTDSTGSESLNEHLSQQRADAVRQYFVANETLPYEKIIAVGYGSMRPIASNETQNGRAMNRRIDIIITPEVKQYN